MNHEEAAIKAFILPRCQERYLGFLPSPKKRAKFTQDLAHFKHLDPRYILNIPPNQQNPESVTKLLASMGAGEKCWVISEWSKFDAREMDLKEALQEIIGYGMGALISCVPGRLAYFEDEDMRCILRR